MPDPAQDEDHPKIREELHRLKKLRAPWYFETSLSRRLMEVRTSVWPGWLALPVTRYAYVPAMLVILGGTAYWYFSPGSARNEVTPALHQSPSPAVPPAKASDPEAKPQSAIPARTNSRVPAAEQRPSSIRREPVVAPQPVRQAGGPEIRAVSGNRDSVGAPAAVQRPAARVSDSSRKAVKDTARSDSMTRVR